MYIIESLVLAMMKEFSTRTGLFSDLGKNADHSQPQEALDQKLNYLLQSIYQYVLLDWETAVR